ncbi:T6SS immunity protein Tdi1 domain-containing protein [Oscillospiraceae bacterium 50-60]
MLFDRFEQDQEASRELCVRYNSVLPPALLNAWQTYGFGSLLNGYLKMINPEEYQALLQESYVLSSTAVPIFVTAFADILTWEKGRYIRIVKYKDGVFEGVAAGFDFFWNDLADGVFDTAHFEIPIYEAAVKKWGQLQFDECFGYTPLLRLGGSRNADHLRKVKIKEHIDLITQAVGKVGA